MLEKIGIERSHGTRHGYGAVDTPRNVEFFMFSRLLSELMFNIFVDLTPGSHGQTVKKVVTRTEVRTVRTVDGRIVEDEYDPGTERVDIERYGYGGKTVNGDGPSTPRKSAGSQSSMDGYRSPRGTGARGGYSSADEGRRVPASNGPSGYMSDSYATPQAGK